MTNAPFPGTLREGDKGPEVGAVQGALRSWGKTRPKHEIDVRRYAPTGTFGHLTTRQVNHYARACGITPSNLYGPNIHRHLARWFTPYGQKVLQELQADRIEQRHREAAVRAAMLGAQKRDQIAYTQYAGRWSGIDLNRRAAQGEVPPKADCSSFDTWCIWNGLMAWSGLVDDIVNNAAWRAGYTGSMMQNGRSLDAPKLGSCPMYGDHGEVTHTAIYVGNGLVVSHGRTEGPELRLWNYRHVIDIRDYF